MPMYWGDYARDTGHLNAAGHGAYLMLIKHYWSTGNPLADDDDELWRVACCDSKKEWQKLRPKIVRLFIQDGGKLRHKRVEKELIKACAITHAKAEAGKKGAEARWQKDGNRMAEASNSQRQTDTPSPSHPLKEVPVLRTGGVPPPEDAQKVLWNEGLATIRVLTNSDQGPARKILGKLVSLAGAHHAELLALIRRAETEQPDSPQAWLLAAARGLNGHAVSTDPFPDALPPGVTTEARTGKLVAGGIYLEQVADAACAAARIPLNEARRHWNAVAEWGQADLTMFQIVSAIQRIADRPGYVVPNSLAWFDRPVREQRNPK
jgi:uncharacterized protein YdaU (DUF1376 family)